MKILVPLLCLVSACASSTKTTRQVASSDGGTAFSCPGQGGAPARTIILTPVREGGRMKMNVRFQYPKGDDYAFTAAWQRPELGSDVKMVHFWFGDNGYANYSFEITVPNSELVSGELRNVKMHESADAVNHAVNFDGDLSCQLK